MALKAPNQTPPKLEIAGFAKPGEKEDFPFGSAKCENGK
jgi:hypothetical protein